MQVEATDAVLIAIGTYATTCYQTTSYCRAAGSGEILPGEILAGVNSGEILAGGDPRRG
jgi:hypothetical protein